MSKPLRLVFMITMTIALSFGFMHHFIPDYNFERLHIFLFNLCTGGTIILYFTMDKGRMTKRLYAFFFLSFVYAFLAFFRVLYSGDCRLPHPLFNCGISEEYAVQFFFRSISLHSKFRQLRSFITHHSFVSQ